ncbi:MAG: TVP38/TMEM64 family protein [Caulobacteraceae bacterium]
MAADSNPARKLSWRRWALAFVLFGGLGLLFLFGLPILGVSGPAEARHWLTLARGPWALPAVILAFAVLAFLGVPQVALIAGAVLAFGPWTGLAYSWTGTMVSALVGFALGRGFGARLIEGWPQARRFSDLVGHNGFMASLAVRLVPFAPFVLINIAGGVTSMSWGAFTLGTAIGILPKIAVIAFAGHSIMAGGAWTFVWLALALAAWGLAGLAARRWMRRGGKADV